MDDEAQLELLHRDHATAVRAFVRRRIGPDDADDIVGDVFVVAWRRIAEVPAEPRAWLLGIARKALGNRRRTARRQRALFDRLASDAETGLSAVAGPGDSFGTSDGTVLRALAGLSSKDREVLLLVTWDGLTNTEAAEVLGVAPGTVGMRVLRARQRLASALERAAASPASHSERHPPASSSTAARSERPPSRREQPHAGSPS